MRRISAVLGLGLVLWSSAGCRECDVCYNIGGPCGYYSLAGRDFPLESSTENAPNEAPASSDRMGTPRNSTQQPSKLLPADPASPKPTPSNTSPKPR